MKLIDTTLLIDLLRGLPEAIKKITDLRGEQIATTEINRFELLVGIYSTKNPKLQKSRLETLNELLSSIMVYEFTPDSSARSAEIAGKMNVKGTPISISDCLIAGTALSNNCSEIITRNSRHFKIIPEISVITY